MKKGFFWIFIVFSFELFGMKKIVYFNTIHESNQSITARVSDGIKLVDTSLKEVEQFEIQPEEEDGFEVSLNSTSGIVRVYDTTNLENEILKFSIEKKSCYTPATVKLLAVAPETKAVLYRPSMGGGDNFVLAIGKKTSDFSVAKVQSLLPFGNIQYYISVDEI